jgi:hypothetical protein
MRFFFYVYIWQFCRQLETEATALMLRVVKYKGKVVPVLKKAPRHEDVLEEWRYSSTHSLTSGLDGGEWSDSRPGHFNPRERVTSTHWIGGWVGPCAGLDMVSNREVPSPYRESNPNHPIIQSVTSDLLTVVNSVKGAGITQL